MDLHGHAGGLSAAPPAARPGAVLLLTALGVAFGLAFLPGYWDPDLDRLREVILAHRNGLITGSVDGLFDGPVTDVAVQTDGKVLVVGYHDWQAGIGIARLDGAGSLDRRFMRRANQDTLGRLTGTADQVEIAGDGGILVAGDLILEGRYRPLVRFHPDGRLDEAFLAASSPLPGDPMFRRSERLVLRADGSMLLIDVGPPVTAILVRRDGTPEPGFLETAEGAAWRDVVRGADDRIAPRPELIPREPESEDEGWYQLVGQYPDGRTLLVRHRPVPRPVPQGEPWVDFMPGCGNEPVPMESHLVRETERRIEELPLGPVGCPRPDGRNSLLEVSSAALRPDGSAVLAGTLPVLASGRCETFAIWRMMPDGRLDPGFRKTATSEISGGTSGARRVAVLHDGGILLAGGFTSVQGQPRAHVARLRPDGTLR